MGRRQEASNKSIYITTIGCFAPNAGHVPTLAKDSDKASAASPTIVYALLLFLKPKHSLTSSNSGCFG
jgi:hypothetical protein